MFTGIVEDLGVVAGVKKKPKDSRITVRASNIKATELSLGESIAVSGVCLTVTSFTGDSFTVDVSGETLTRTTLSELTAGKVVNLERALLAGGRMGGHIVNGHVDGVGVVKKIIPSGESEVFWFSLPHELARYVVEKGSIAVDGVSLTVNEVEGNGFSVNIIPFTQTTTTFGDLKPGQTVNIECDIIGKYVEKFVSGWEKKPSLKDILEDS